MISDLQIPWEHRDALKFCMSVQKEFKISGENILCVGDEIDAFFGSSYDKDPDIIDFTPRKELAIARDRIADWSQAFPQMKLCVSNHGLRWLAKARNAQIPSEVLIPYKKLFNMPRGWVFKEEWIFPGKYPFRMIHGMGYSGVLGARNAAVDSGMSTIIGHLHAHAGVLYTKNSAGRVLWGMNVGSLIDEDSFAFAYGKYMRSKAMLSCGVILDNGKTPLVIPL